MSRLREVVTQRRNDRPERSDQLFNLGAKHAINHTPDVHKNGRDLVAEDEERSRQCCHARDDRQQGHEERAKRHQSRPRHRRRKSREGRRSRPGHERRNGRHSRYQ